MTFTMSKNVRCVPMIILADLWLSLCVLTVILIAADCRSHPQRMGVMNMTWPLTGLYFGPIAGWLYRTLGRSQRTGDHAGAHHHQHMLGSSGSHDVSIRATLVSTTHCGGGCVLGDLIGETLAGAFSLTLFGSKLAAGWILDFVLAFLLGIAFQYWSIRPMQPDMTSKDAFLAALKADTLSITAFEIGMFAVMGLRLAIAPNLTIWDAGFWIWMQVAMLAGFATSFPANRWLVRAGLKHAM
ncbi:hypothetical protein A0U93_00635 [Neoasaia chiangmaiensis]|uniref:DUF4396 domain-containing protein n=1 Tax=Neoasaia chiangmaiensis TaxID=320497 RepID=A0A1U9KLR3_9PROT|nr:hypothetical protein A0U93_00635 [Neoasaia chiangmaiensis]